MKPQTIETIIRHLKGILAALEKEKNEPTPMVYTFNGKKIEDLSDIEVSEAFDFLRRKENFFVMPVEQSSKYSHLLIEEASKRNIELNW